MCFEFQGVGIMVILKFLVLLKYVDVMFCMDFRCLFFLYVYNCLILVCRVGILIEFVGCIVYICEDKYLYVINMWRYVLYCVEQVNIR